LTRKTRDCGSACQLARHGVAMRFEVSKCQCPTAPPARELERLPGARRPARLGVRSRVPILVNFRASRRAERRAKNEPLFIRGGAAIAGYAAGSRLTWKQLASDSEGEVCHGGTGLGEARRAAPKAPRDRGGAVYTIRLVRLGHRKLLLLNSPTISRAPGHSRDGSSSRSISRSLTQTDVSAAVFLIYIT
jgi:hypothetical protein